MEFQGRGLQSTRETLTVKLQHLEAMFKRVSSLLAIGGVLTLSAPAYSMNLEEAVALAVEDNPRVAAAQASRRANDYVLKQARGRYSPEVEISASAGYERYDQLGAFGIEKNFIWRKARKGTVTVRQVLFDGFDRRNGRYQAQARISASAQKIMARAETVALDAIEAYIDVLRHRRLIVLGNQNVDRHRKLLKLVQERVTGGKNSVGDLDQTKERLQAAIALVSQIKIARDVAAAKFKNAVGVGPGRLQSTKFPKNKFLHSNEAVAAAIEGNFKLAALRHEIDATGFKTEQFRASLFPVISVEGSATRGEDLGGSDDRADDLKAMVMLRWKLIDGGVRRNRIHELTEREFVKIAEYDSMIRDVRQEIEISWSRLMEGGKQVAAKRSQLKETQKVVASYRKEYEADKRSLLDVLDAENTRFGIEFDLSNAISIRRFAAYQLMAHTGDLLKTLNVARPAGAQYEPDISMLRPASSAKSAFVIPPLKQE